MNRERDTSVCSVVSCNFILKNESTMFDQHTSQHMTALSLPHSPYPAVFSLLTSQSFSLYTQMLEPKKKIKAEKGKPSRSILCAEAEPYVPLRNCQLPDICGPSYIMSSGITF